LRYRIEHETRLIYDGPIWEHQCELRLTPRQDEWLRLLDHSIDIYPEANPQVLRDGFGNPIHTVSLLPRHTRFVTRMRAEVETLRANPFAFEPLPLDQESPWLARRLAEEPRLRLFLGRSSLTPNLAPMSEAYGPFPERDRQLPLGEAIMKAMGWIQERLRYDPDATHVHSGLELVFQEGGGVCQDFAHLLIALIRGWGYPARYVMGYQDPGNTPHQKGAAPNQATHAWIEALVPGVGWMGFDPTNLLAVNDLYIPVAVGRDSTDTPPQRGCFRGGASERMEIAVRVTPIRSDEVGV